jgi:hypothetical protein
MLSMLPLLLTSPFLPPETRAALLQAGDEPMQALLRLGVTEGEAAELLDAGPRCECRAA